MVRKTSLMAVASRYDLILFISTAFVLSCHVHVEIFFCFVIFMGFSYIYIYIYLWLWILHFVIGL